MTPQQRKEKAARAAIQVLFDGLHQLWAIEGVTECKTQTEYHHGGCTFRITLEIEPITYGENQ